MISRIRTWINARQKRIAQEKRMELQKQDELLFDRMLAYTIDRILSRNDCTEEAKERMITSAEKIHKEAIESRRKLREAGEDILLGIYLEFRRNEE